MATISGKRFQITDGASTPTNLFPYTVTEAVYGLSTVLANTQSAAVSAAATSAASLYVPLTRTVNSKALSSNITLSLDDVADGSTRKLANYLPLTGGTLTNSTGYILTINRTGSAAPTLIAFQQAGTLKGFLGIGTDGAPVYLNSSATSYNIYHSGNFRAGTEYVSISGAETISGAKTFTGNVYLYGNNPTLVFKNSSGNFGRLYMKATDGPFYRVDSTWANEYQIYDAGNSNKSDVAWKVSALDVYDRINFATGGTMPSEYPSVILANSSAFTIAANSTLPIHIGWRNVSTPAIYATTSGNVGIGTNSPANKLHVSGTAFFCYGSGTYADLGARVYGNSIDGMYRDGSWSFLHLNYNSPNNVTICNGGGNVGIGTTSPGYKLDVAGATRIYRASDNTGVVIGYAGSTIDGATSSGFGSLYLNYNTSSGIYLCYGGGNVTIGTGSNTAGSKLYVIGTIASSGDQVISSDAALKKNWREVGYGIEEIANCTVGRFDWKDGHGTSVGSKAQDWLPLVPELVHGEEGNMTLAYGQIALVNSILLAKHETEQDKEIRKLKKRVRDLEKQLNIS